jgi:hypothetical protein
MTEQEDLEQIAKEIARSIEMYLDSELPDTENRTVKYTVKNGTIQIDVTLSNATILEGEIDTLYFTLKITKTLDPDGGKDTLYATITAKKQLEHCLVPYIKSLAKTITSLALF